MTSLNFLETKSQKCSSYTHVLMSPYKKSFYLEYTEQDDFLEQYCHNVLTTQRVNLGVAERINNVYPVIVDIDIKVEHQNEYKDEIYLYSIDDVKKVIQIYFDAFDELFNTIDDEQYRCVLFEKDPYISGNYVKHGFHLHFPYLFLSSSDHRHHLIPFVKQKINNVIPNGFDDTRNTPWLMYKSVKSVDKYPYIFSQLFDKNLNCLDKDILRDYKIYDCQSNQIDMSNKDISYYYPRIFSVNIYGRQEYLKKVSKNVIESDYVKNIIKLQEKERTTTFKDINTDINTKYEPASNIKKLIDMLSDSRANDFNEWLKVGWAIFNVCGPGRDSLQLFLDFSSRSNKWEANSEEYCIRQWSKMKPGNLKIGTLKYYASIDNPELYNKYCYDHIKKDLFHALSGTHYAIAQLLYNDYKDIFKCVSLAPKKWYMFQDHIWIESEQGIDLRSKISTALMAKYDEAKVKASSEALGAEPYEKKFIDKKIEQIDRIRCKLETTGFKDSVMKECNELFYARTFEEKLDANPRITGLRNGVFDIQLGLFRPGQPSDYITKQMNVEYKEFDKYDPNVQDVKKFLSQIFPDKTIRDYFMDVASTLFMGGNYEKKIYICSGGGDNGKSVTIKLIKKMFGEYAIDVPTTLFTGKQTQSSAASPELVRSRGSRLIIAQEPEEEDELNIGTLKRLSGGDEFWVRDLFQGSTAREIIPLFKMFFICNEPPNLTKADKATWNRVRVIPFESTFCDEAPDTEEERMKQKTFVNDPHFSENLEGMSKAFTWMLINHFIKIKGKVRCDPDKVRMATDKYKSKNDIIQEFINDVVEERDGCITTPQDIYHSFKTWHKDGSGLPSSSMLSRAKLKDKFTKIWGEPIDGVWIGYFLKGLNTLLAASVVPILQKGNDGFDV